MRITLYLLREGLEISQALLANSEQYSEIPLHDPGEEGVSWKLFVFQPPSRPVSWINSLQAIAVRPDALTLYGQSSGAVLLITVDNHLFAITFGTGFHAISSLYTEPDFGLKVSANSIDPDKMTLAEARGLGKGARNAVSSLPVPNRMFALRLATNEEWIRRVGGKSVDSEFAVSVSGADSLRLSLDDFNLYDLPYVLRKCLAKFCSMAYREHLPQLDYFRRLPSTRPIISVLEALVADDLRARRSDIGFAAPDEFHFYNVDHFTLKRRRKEVTLMDLSSEAVYQALDELDAWSDPLGSVKVIAIASDSPMGPPRTLQQYVVANVALNAAAGKSDHYVLTAGAWFSVASDYIEYLDQIMAQIQDITDTSELPAWDDDWLRANVDGKYAEQRYNVHAANASGRILMDRNLYHGPAGQRVEVCDVLTQGKKLICVKRLDGSDTMIHLFEQGAVSATLLKHPGNYRDFVLDHLARAGGGDSFGREADWQIVFAIATGKAGPIKTLLPFFARASLAANLNAIIDRGYEVALAKITMTS